VLVARNSKNLSQTEELIKSVNPDVQVLSVATDVSNQASVEALFKTVKEKFGHVDVLVNNAGVLNCVDLIGDAAPGKWWADFVSLASFQI
jgi:NADP-dependent 3-hydroxy acid dehydrogenase YdfG